VRRAPRQRSGARGKALILAVGSTVAVLLPGQRGAAQDAAEARAALRSGAYQEAIDQYRLLVRAEPRAAPLRTDLMEALVSTGRYEEAVEVGLEAPEPGALANATGEALVRLGRLDEAERAFQAAASAGGPWARTAEVNLAELLFQRGRLDEAMERFDGFIDVYNAADGGLSARDLVAVGRAVRYLGRTQPSLFQDALRAFDEAARTDPTWAEPLVRAGFLFLEKYDSPAAKEEFEKVLASNPRHPGALLGMAKSLMFDGSAGAGAALDTILALNENHVEARALVAMSHLTNEGHAAAKREAERALEVNPSSLAALTALAGSHLLVDDRTTFAQVRARALDINPSYAQLDVELAELSVQTRRYAQAVERAQAAVELDSAAWEAWGLLGMNQLRVGEITEGRANLERAFAGDPFNPWFKNNLDLLDTFDGYGVHPTDHFELFLHDSEVSLLAPYLAPIAEEAFDSLSRRYGVEPELPVRAELFPNHADFSVRTLGEAGLGALGVSFGRVLVMDSPSAREVGDYNWASVFWHELAHTFHLAMSDNRVPRWFSEGLAVHEQRKAREGWGHQPTIPFLTALRDDRLKTVSELNDGFMRPDYPQQVVFSYYQASLVFELIEQTHGFDAIRNMLVGYRDGHTTAELVDRELDLTVEELDEQFDTYIRDRFAKPLAGIVQLGDPPSPEADVAELRRFALAHPGDLLTRLRLGALLFRDERWDDAEEEFRAALRIFPEYGGPDSPYYFLARIHRERGELDMAQAALARLNALSESNYSARILQSEILTELGRVDESADALEAAVTIWPYELELHERLAELGAQLSDAPREVRERKAIVALDPADKAEALYRLARAQHAAGDLAGARRSVMGALEIAPNYEEALELLLVIRAGGS
jgi:tetratricopeptide (TPR) repeat protein